MVVMSNKVRRIARKLLGRRGTFILRSIVSEVLFHLMRLIPYYNEI